MKRILMTLALVAGVGGSAVAQQQQNAQPSYWTCEVVSQAPTGKFRTSGMTFQVQINPDFTAVGQGTQTGGGLVTQMSFQGRWQQNGKDVMIQGQMQTQMLGVRPFYFQSRAVSDTMLSYNTVLTGGGKYASQCQRTG